MSGLSIAPWSDWRPWEKLMTTSSILFKCFITCCLKSLHNRFVCQILQENSFLRHGSPEKTIQSTTSKLARYLKKEILDKSQRSRLLLLLLLLAEAHFFVAFEKWKLSLAGCLFCHFNFIFQSSTVAFNSQQFK